MTSEEKTKVIGCDFFLIHKFMLRDLALSGGELLVFAFLYSFFKSHGSYYGSREYIAESTGLSLRSVAAAIKSLKEKELIEKGESEDGWTTYTLHPECEKRVQKLHGGVQIFPLEGAKIAQGVCKNFTQGVQKLHLESAKISPNNKEYNKDYNKVDNKADKRTTREGRAGEHTKKEFFKEEGQEGEYTDRESRGGFDRRKNGYQRAGGGYRGSFGSRNKQTEWLSRVVEDRVTKFYEESRLHNDDFGESAEEK